MRFKLTLCLIPIAGFIAAATLAEWREGVRLRERQGELLRQREAGRHSPTESPGRMHPSEAAAREPAGPPPGDAAPRPAEPPGLPPFQPGEWTPQAAWRNEGRSTPRATVATLLWAAGGGDLREFQDALEYDDATRRKARELFLGLSPVVRNYYATAEDLVAGVTAKNIPLTEAQLMWLNQADADHAVAGLRLAGAGRPPAPAAGVVPGTADEPPHLPEQSPEKMVVLALHRTDTGWRVVVPAAALGRVAGELAPPVAKR